MNKREVLETFQTQIENQEFEHLDASISQQLKEAGKEITSLSLHYGEHHLRLPIHTHLQPTRSDFTVYSALEGLDGFPPDLILCPSLSDSLAAYCRELGLAHADLNGRLFIKTPWLYLNHSPTSVKFRNPVPEVELFSPKSSRLVRSLLAQPRREWSQEDLRKVTQLSRGLVSRLVRSLEERQLINKINEQERNKLYQLTAPDRLLDLWKAEDLWRKRSTIRQFSTLGNDPERTALSIQPELEENQPVFTQWFAANLRHPFTTSAIVSAYVRNLDDIDLKAAREVKSGGNIWLISPRDEGVFYETQEVNGFNLACDPQIYLDLLQVNQRGPEQAEALRQWKGFNQ